MKQIFTIVFFFLLILNLSASEDFDIKTSYYLADKEVSISQIKNIEEFIPSEGKSFTLLKKNCWVKLEVLNNTSSKQTRVFRFRFPYMDYVTLYQDSKEEQKHGLLNNYNSHINSLQNNTFKVDIDALEKQTLFIKISSAHAIKTFLVDFSEERYNKIIFNEKVIFALFYGILFAMVFYNFFIWFSIRKKEFLYYITFHTVFLIGILSWTGFGFENIWPTFPILNYYSFGIIGNLLYGFQILYITSYLDTQSHLPKITSLLKKLAYLFFILSLSSIFIQLTIVYESLSFISTVSLISITLYLIFYKKQILAFYILLAQLIIMSGNIFMILSDFSLLDGSFFTDYFYVWGASIEVLLMSFALAYKYKALETEKIKEQARRIEIENILIEKHKLSILGEVFNNLSHQWRQPLAHINSVVFKIEDDFYHNKLNEQNLEDNLNHIESQTNYLSLTLDEFRVFTQNTKSERFLVSELVDETKSILGFPIEKYNINLRVKNHIDNPKIFSNKNLLKQVLVIIINNAKDAFIIKHTQNPQIIIETKLVNNRVEIEISNNAGKIPIEIREKIFEPYFTTNKNDDNSSSRGLGLHIAKIIITEKLKSKISVSCKNDWTLFCIKLL